MIFSQLRIDEKYNCKTNKRSHLLYIKWGSEFNGKNQYRFQNMDGSPLVLFRSIVLRHHFFVGCRNIYCWSFFYSR